MHIHAESPNGPTPPHPTHRRHAPTLPASGAEIPCYKPKSEKIRPGIRAARSSLNKQEYPILMDSGRQLIQRKHALYDTEICDGDVRAPIRQEIQTGNKPREIRHTGDLRIYSYHKTAKRRKIKNLT